jgi:ATP-dependent exoDNAse (exonuclease V) beta subunit
LTAMNKALRDDAARRDAISVHDRSILVEAGAGSGKTAVMAGRVAAMLAEGIAPNSIAAVTFTELAASELLFRVREFVGELAAGNVPAELRIAFTTGLSDGHKANLASASAAIDEITCSTIHGFCQRLIRPYPVEADIDPGAGVMDGNHADLAFIEIVETWLREQLSGGEGGIIAEMVLQDPGEAVGLIHKVVANLRKRRIVTGPAATRSEPHIRRFRKAVTAFTEFVREAPAAEEETKQCAGRFADMADALKGAAIAETPAGLIRLLVAAPHPDLCTKSGTFLAYKKKGKWVEAAKRAGLAKAEGERLAVDAEARYVACCEAWHAMLQNVAARVLSDLIAQVQPTLDRFRDYKRSAALLDFDDLIFSARNLLRDHDSVRRALATRFSHVLVDEFQDTDPLQTEIFWRLCGELPADDERCEWTAFVISAPARFSSSATRSRRSIGSAARTSAPTSRPAMHSSATTPTACCRFRPTSAPVHRSSNT